MKSHGNWPLTRRSFCSNYYKIKANVCLEFLGIKESEMQPMIKSCERDLF
jgi:hypothetical protein